MYIASLIANHPYIWNDKEFKEVYSSTELTCNKIIAWCKLTWEVSEASCWRGKSGSKKVLKFPLYIKNVWAVMRYFAFNTSVQYSTFFCERQRQVILAHSYKKIQKLPITYINPSSFCSSPCFKSPSAATRLLRTWGQPTWRHSILKMAARGKFRKPIENRRYQYP